MKAIGTREEVIRGFALRTKAGLTIQDFRRKPDGTWVYRRKSQAAKQRWNADPGLRAMFAAERAPAFGSGRVRRGARKATRSIRRGIKRARSFF